MMFWYDHDIGAWGWALMTLSTIAFWGLLIAGIVAAARLLSEGGGRPDRAPDAVTAERVLAERYARGEIDDDEYQRRLQVLRGAMS